MKKFERKTVYIYEINGQEKVKVTDIEEACYWDVVFDVAEQVDEVLRETPPDLKLDEAQRTELSLYLAKNRQALAPLLVEGEEVEPVPEPAQESKPKKDEKPVEDKKTTGSVKKQPFVQEFKRPVERSKDGFSL